MNNKLNLSQRDIQLGKYNSARMNLLLVVIVTLINVVLGLMGSGSYFLFSAFFPYFFVFNGMYFCGKMPDDWYEFDKFEYNFFDPSYLAVMVSIAVVILALYLVCWFMSKNQKSGWMIAALVLFGIDTVGYFLMGGLSIDTILDLLFHVWVLYYLISGVIAAIKLKSLPPDEDELKAAAETEGANYFPAVVTLKNGKEVVRISANYFRGSESVGGKLYFYQDRIIFRSHGINIQTGDTAIRYADMTETKATKNLWLSNGLVICTSDGIEHRFVVNNRDDIKSFIDRKIPSVNYQQ